MYVKNIESLKFSNKNQEKTSKQSQKKNPFWVQITDCSKDPWNTSLLFLGAWLKAAKKERASDRDRGGVDAARGLAAFSHLRTVKLGHAREPSEAEQQG